MIIPDMSRPQDVRCLSVQPKAAIMRAASTVALPARKKLAPTTSFNFMLAASINTAD